MKRLRVEAYQLLRNALTVIDWYRKLLNRSFETCSESIRKFLRDWTLTADHVIRENGGGHFGKEVVIDELTVEQDTHMDRRDEHLVDERHVGFSGGEVLTGQVSLKYLLEDL